MLLSVVPALEIGACRCVGFDMLAHHLYEVSDRPGEPAVAFLRASVFEVGFGFGMLA